MGDENFGKKSFLCCQVKETVCYPQREKVSQIDDRPKPMPPMYCCCTSDNIGCVGCDIQHCPFTLSYRKPIHHGYPIWTTPRLLNGT